MNSSLIGIIAPSLTAFQADGTVNFPDIRHHVKWLVENGVDGIVPCGSSGEFIALSIDEHKKIVETVIDEVGDSVPIYPATGRYATQETIALSRHAEYSGASAVMIITPYYLCPNRDAVLNHYRKIRDAIGIEIILTLNIPVSIFTR